LSKLESNKNLEATKINKTKFSKIAKFTETYCLLILYTLEKQIKTFAL
jgi:hypothetical protein